MNTRPINWQHYRNKTLTRTLSLLVTSLFLAGCVELAESILNEDGYCYGCNWIIQEWDYPGWSTHNSDQYETEEICERALAEQFRQSPSRGHRCIFETDVSKEDPSQFKDQPHCYGCDWVVEVEEYGRWQRQDFKTHITEGVCQQTLWHMHKENPDRNYRCRNLDR